MVDRLPAMVIDTLREQWARISKMDEEIATIEQRIKLWLKNNEACKRIAEIRSIFSFKKSAAQTGKLKILFGRIRLRTLSLRDAMQRQPLAY